MQVPNLNNINNSNTPQAQNENVAVKKSVQGKYNLVYSCRCIVYTLYNEPLGLMPSDEEWFGAAP